MLWSLIIGIVFLYHVGKDILRYNLFSMNGMISHMCYMGTHNCFKAQIYLPTTIAVSKHNIFIKITEPCTIYFGTTKTMPSKSF